MASGYAYTDARTDTIGYYKDGVAGSNLPLKGLPRNSQNVILHTRYATQGPVSNNDNNHPVLSPDGNIALIHNGVIWNDFQLRKGLLSDYSLAEVDTSVIPALIQHTGGVTGFSQLAGDAAVAWLANGDHDTLHLARIESSPVTYTNLRDGSFVFASTATILIKALEEMNLSYGELFTMSELDYFKISGGVIQQMNTLPEPQGFQMGWAASTRGATSGGHGIGKGTGTASRAAGSSKYDEYDDIADQAAIDEMWGQFAGIGGRAMYQDDYEGGNPNDGSSDAEYFTIDTDGDMKTYANLDEMENDLIWTAGRAVDGLGKGENRWINGFIDIGSFSVDGSMNSWVDSPDEIIRHEDPNGEGLGYISEGVGMLRSMVGR